MKHLSFSRFLLLLALVSRIYGAEANSSNSDDQDTRYSGVDFSSLKFLALAKKRSHDFPINGSSQRIHFPTGNQPGEAFALPISDRTLVVRLISYGLQQAGGWTTLIPEVVVLDHSMHVIRTIPRRTFKYRPIHMPLIAGEFTLDAQAEKSRYLVIVGRQPGEFDFALGTGSFALYAVPPDTKIPMFASRIRDSISGSLTITLDELRPKHLEAPRPQ